MSFPSTLLARTACEPHTVWTPTPSRRARRTIQSVPAMDTIRRVFATYVGSDSPASISTSRLVPRRLSFALSSSPSSGATPFAREGGGVDDVAPRKASRLGQSSQHAGSKRARERTEDAGAAGTSGPAEDADADAGGAKRARHEESEDVVKRVGDGNGDGDLAPWPSVKRKRDEEREDEDAEDDEAGPSLQRRRVSADGERRMSFEPYPRSPWGRY